MNCNITLVSIAGTDNFTNVSELATAEMWLKTQDLPFYTVGQNKNGQHVVVDPRNQIMFVSDSHSKAVEVTDKYYHDELSNDEINELNLFNAEWQHAEKPTY